MAAPTRRRVDRHPGGPLYGHLCRVQERLAALGSDVATQLAGPTHAVYGTDGFDLALLDRTNQAARVLGPLQVQPFVDLSIVNELDVFEQDR